jgi:hypothetical protein
MAAHDALDAAMSVFNATVEQSVPRVTLSRYVPARVGRTVAVNWEVAAEVTDQFASAGIAPVAVSRAVMAWTTKAWPFIIAGLANISFASIVKIVGIPAKVSRLLPDIGMTTAEPTAATVSAVTVTCIVDPTDAFDEPLSKLTRKEYTVACRNE